MVAGYEEFYYIIEKDLRVCFIIFYSEKIDESNNEIITFSVKFFWQHNESGNQICPDYNKKYYKIISLNYLKKVNEIKSYFF